MSQNKPKLKNISTLLCVIKQTSNLPIEFYFVKYLLFSTPKLQTKLPSMTQIFCFPGNKPRTEAPTFYIHIIRTHNSVYKIIGNTYYVGVQVVVWVY